LCELKVYDVVSTKNFLYRIFYEADGFLGNISC